MPYIHKVDGVRPQPIFVHTSLSNVVTNGNGMVIRKVLKGTVHLDLCLISRLLSATLLL